MFFDQRTNAYVIPYPKRYIGTRLKDLGLPPVFSSIYLEIDRNSARDGKSYLQVGTFLRRLGYKDFSRKTKILSDVITCLKFLVEKRIIDIDECDLETISYNTCIICSINNPILWYAKGLVYLDLNTYELIMKNTFESKKTSLINIALGFANYCIPKADNSGEMITVFVHKLENLADLLGISQPQLIKRINDLLNDNGENMPVMIKKVTHNMKTIEEEFIGIPNIYVFNTSQKKMAIDSAQKYIANLKKH